MDRPENVAKFDDIEQRLVEKGLLLPLDCGKYIELKGGCAKRPKMVSVGKNELVLKKIAGVLSRADFGNFLVAVTGQHGPKSVEKSTQYCQKSAPDNR